MLLIFGDRNQSVSASGSVQPVFQGCLGIHKAGVSSHEPEAGHQDEEQLAVDWSCEQMKIADDHCSMLDKYVEYMIKTKICACVCVCMCVCVEYIDILTYVYILCERDACV